MIKKTQKRSNCKYIIYFMGSGIAIIQYLYIRTNTWITIIICLYVVCILNHISLTEFSILFQHWECKFFFTMFYYFLGANYMWILVEGLYLHMLVSVAIFSENSGVKWLVLFGWGRYMLLYILNSNFDWIWYF